MPEHKKTNPAAVFRLGHLGDVVLTTGVLDHWRRSRDMRFTFITREASAPALENHPAVDEIVTVDEDALKSFGAWFRHCGELAERIGSMPLFDLHGTLRSRILSLRWRGKVRRYPKFGLERRMFSRTRAERYRKRLERTNVPQRYAMTLDTPPPPADRLLPVIAMRDGELDAARARLEPLRRNGALVALHPYATHPSKQWPEDHWRRLIELLDRANIDWFVVGRAQAPFIARQQDLTNETSLRETCALLAEADVMVTNDSGPMHLASGVGTPVVGLFGPTARAWGFFPAGAEDIVLERKMDCRPCSLHGGAGCASGLECLASISPEAAMGAIRTILKV
ncbi:glycosyltransferase family 9 protein [Salidesulfovibrio onnuriiensis]|uniref:glycosyltransferase family 9 protein n=1 Tax=Salidesulfovibrio onnuriiensis TaxID=2583823 RepID=UPI0011CC0BD3|nr:glycosyltransferase family 9 protein [Salidesulfovibrio onnuriiensis]